MTFRRVHAAPPLVAWLLTCVGCSDASVPGVAATLPDAGVDANADADADAGDPPVLPPAGFESYCEGRTWTETLVPATVARLGKAPPGKYLGTLQSPEPDGYWRPETQEAMKVIPEHPFVARKIRVNFGEGTGTARLRLVGTFGRSYPNSFPSTDPETLPDFQGPADLTPPVEVYVENAQPDVWTEVDIPETFLLPTQHYMIVYEHVDGPPSLGVEDKGADDIDQSYLWLPWKPASQRREMYGVPGNYRMELVGSYFCSIEDTERHFIEVASTPFNDLRTTYAAFTDLDGDGHDDLVLTPVPKPLAFLGDGKGTFTPTSFDPFPDIPRPKDWIVDVLRIQTFAFGDLDNDGTVDAFLSTYVVGDNDSDHYRTDVPPYDCDDNDPKIHPTAIEADNRKDDDCDGLAEASGSPGDDQDNDGFSLSQGDCNDTRSDVYPGAPEILDGRDNDCNGRADETFGSRILLNDGKGHFTTVDNPAVEALSPSTAVALGDGNVDGKLDVYAGSWLLHYPDDPTAASRYFVNLGGAVFENALEKAGMSIDPARPPYGVIWTDYNDDGLPDIYVNNYHLQDNLLWKNVGGGAFQDVAAEVGAAHDEIPSPYSDFPGGHSYCSDPGDFDNDGDIDIFLPNLSHPRTQPWADPSMLLVNQGPPSYTFVNQRRELGIIYNEGDLNSSWADYDNDGDIDLFIGTGYGAHFGRFYRNDWPKGFTDITYETRLNVHTAQMAVWSDVDEDGDLDVLVTGNGPAEWPWTRVNLFINSVGNKNNWVFFDLRGTQANRSAVGARVMLSAGGKNQLREVTVTNSHQSSHLVHFGLGAAKSIGNVRVRWPGGATETFTGVTANGRFVLTQGKGEAVAR